MSSTVESERKGIFRRNKAPISTAASASTSPKSFPSSPQSTSRPSSRPASRSTSRAASPAKLPTPPVPAPRVEIVKKVRRSPSDTKTITERVSRSHVQRYVAISPRAKDFVFNADGPSSNDESTETIVPSLKITDAAETIDDLSSPFKKVSELIENLDLSLDNISGDSGNKDKHIDDLSKGGEYLSAHGSNESIESEFSIAPESPLPVDPKKRLLTQINELVEATVQNKTDSQKIHALLVQLSDLITNAEQEYKRRMKNMKDIQDNAFAELFLEKNEQITQLQLEIEMMKRDNSKEIAKVKSSEELMSTKTEVCHLKEILSNRNTEINQLTYKLVDAQSYIESLEKEKYAKTEIHDDDEESIRNHFKTVKKALLSNRTLLKMMQSRQIHYKTQT